MSRIPLYGIFPPQSFDGQIIRRDSIQILNPTNLEFAGMDVHRLGLRFLYGEWNFAKRGDVYDLEHGTRLVATIDRVGPPTGCAVTLGRAIRWQAPTAFWTIEADVGTWVLSSSSFRYLVFGENELFYLGMGAFDFELHALEGKHTATRGQLVADLPVGRAVCPTDMTGFTRWQQADYLVPLVRPRFEFREIRLIDAATAAGAINGPSCIDLFPRRTVRAPVTPSVSQGPTP